MKPRGQKYDGHSKGHHLGCTLEGRHRGGLPQAAEAALTGVSLFRRIWYT